MHGDLAEDSLRQMELRGQDALGHGALLMPLSHWPPPPPPLLASSSPDLEIVGCPGAAPGSFLLGVTLFVDDFMLPRH